MNKAQGFYCFVPFVFFCRSVVQVKFRDAANARLLVPPGRERRNPGALVECAPSVFVSPKSPVVEEIDLTDTDFPQVRVEIARLAEADVWATDFDAIVEQLQLGNEGKQSDGTPMPRLTPSMVQGWQEARAPLA